ncbi:MAG: hypothetical protein AVDCRST_MAG59-4114 [uncultured Thermomicrobiales bacterium]|uniref:DUF305 domain-containing protein n=1 Tax=uncultured Thermomicrobiales bacterium TaxID=1645740 RepID=A0A6J4VI39_9BACT|nr:MAG: hypothetical protein AVDCRST_MAG59-4114 [uncultured Thermomicrobiales bacterium]
MSRGIVRAARIAACASFGMTIGLGAVNAQSTPGADDGACTSPPPAMAEQAGMTMATPGAEMGAMPGMDMASPAVGMDHASMDFDQMYIDMMVPHHASILAMAEAALPRLEDERLREIADAIVEAQGQEIEELRGFREEFYGDPEPMPMDDGMMAAMGEMMPSMAGTMEEMAFQMDAAAQVAALCAAEDADLAFVDLTIPHHEMAIDASRDALDRATHPEIRGFAQRVIDAQQREIDELGAIRRELYGSATPAAVSSGS